MTSDRSVQDLMSLAWKQAVITGGAGHLGLEISRALLELVASVLVLGRTAEKMAPLTHQFGERARFHAVDLNSRDAVAALDTVLPARLDILVNDAFTWPKNPRSEEVEWDAVVHPELGHYVAGDDGAAGVRAHAGERRWRHFE